MKILLTEKEIKTISEWGEVDVGNWISLWLISKDNEEEEKNIFDYYLSDETDEL